MGRCEPSARQLRDHALAIGEDAQALFGLLGLLGPLGRQLHCDAFACSRRLRQPLMHSPGNGENHIALAIELYGRGPRDADGEIGPVITARPEIKPLKELGLPVPPALAEKAGTSKADSENAARDADQLREVTPEEVQRVLERELGKDWKLQVRFGNSLGQLKNGIEVLGNNESIRFEPPGPKGERHALLHLHLHPLAIGEHPAHTNNPVRAGRLAASGVAFAGRTG